MPESGGLAAACRSAAGWHRLHSDCPGIHGFEDQLGTLWPCRLVSNIAEGERGQRQGEKAMMEDSQGSAVQPDSTAESEWRLVS